MIGINSRGQGRGIGFTIPINLAKRVAGELVGEGKIARGYLGVSIQPLSRELAEYWGIPKVEGVVVNGVQPESPAAAAGLQIGDIISGFEGEPVSAEKDEDVGQFQRLVALAPIGSTVEIEVFRSGDISTLQAELGSQPKVVPDEQETDFGFTVQELTQNLMRSHRLAERDGVLVSFVERGSEAAEAGMAPGDLIVRIDDVAIADIASFRSTLEATESGDRLSGRGQARQRRALSATHTAFEREASRCPYPFEKRRRIAPDRSPRARSIACAALLVLAAVAEPRPRTNRTCGARPWWRRSNASVPPP